MSAESLDLRMTQMEKEMAELKGAYHQIDRRLSDIRSEMVDVKLRLEGLDRKIDGNFRALISWMLGQTGVILGAVIAVAFALRHG